MKDKDLLKKIDWFFSKGRWWKFISVGTIFSILMIGLQEYLFSTSWVLGFVFGILLCLVDFISGYNDGFSVMEWIIDWIEGE